MPNEWNADVSRRALVSPELPPPDFDLATASDRDRVRYGFPAEPDQQTQPAAWAKWERNLHRPWRRVLPEYELRPARTNREGQRPEGAGSSPNWSGAVAFPAAAGDAFSFVIGSWTVPNAYPPRSTWNGHSYNNGFYNALHWIGLDGWTGAGANDVLQIGTGTDVSVVDGAISVSCYCWYEWWYGPLNNGYSKLSGFTVTPGDLISAVVCSTAPNSGTAYIGNVTRAEYVSQVITDPSPALTLTGNTAEWIVEREGLGQTFSTLADYGGVFFSDCVAGGIRWEIDLNAAEAVNMTVGSAITSTGTKVSEYVLQCYYGTAAP